MAAKNSIFKKADQFFFEQITLFKKSVAYQKYIEMTRHLELSAKFALNGLITTVYVLLPLFVVLVLLLFNFSYRAKLDFKKQILKISRQIIANDSQVGRLQRQLLSGSSLKNQTDLERKIRDIANTHKIKLTDLQVKNFKNQTLNPDYGKFEADIHFQNLSTDLFVELIKKVSFNNITIEDLSVELEQNNGLLKGFVSISQAYKK